MENNIEYFRAKLECTIKTKLNFGKNLSPVYYHCAVDGGKWIKCATKVHPFTALVEGSKFLYDDTILKTVSRKFYIEVKDLLEFNRGLSNRPSFKKDDEFYNLGAYIRKTYYHGDK